MIKIQGQFTLEDFKAAQKLHAQTARSGSSLRFVVTPFVLVFGLLAVGGIILVSLQGSDYWVGALFPILVLAFYLIFRFSANPKQIARLFEQQKELSAPFEMELSEDGFAMTNSYGNYRIPWKDFTKWKEDRELILLYRSDLAFNLLPKRLLAGTDQLDYVHGLLAGSDIPDAYKVRRPKLAGTWLIYILLFVAICAMVYFNIRAGR